MRLTLALKALVLTCVACGVALLWTAFTYSFWQLSSMIALDNDNGDRALFIDIPVLGLTSALTVAVLIALGRQIAESLKDVMRREDVSA